MQAAVKSDFISVKDYLAAEEGNATRQEYLGGLVFEKQRETRLHNEIVGNFGLRPTI